MDFRRKTDLEQASSKGAGGGGGVGIKICRLVGCFVSKAAISRMFLTEIGVTTVLAVWRFVDTAPHPMIFTPSLMDFADPNLPGWQGYNALQPRA